MGSGSRFKVWRSDTFGLGLNVARFPFSLTISVHLLAWGISVGFGKGYDQ
jgi:hypothetical protein